MEFGSGFSKFEKQLMNKPDLEIHRKTRETYKLIHTIRRYARRLIKEGLRNAKGTNITVEEVQPDRVDDDPIIDLARDNYPSLYRRYHSAVFRYYQNLGALEDLLKRN